MAAGYDVVVVGGGIGGLTVAALLSARGVSTCVLERQSQVGGCIGRVEFSGLEFEPGMGVYTSFGDGEIYDRIFAELPVDVPATSLVTQPYVVRLANGTDVKLFSEERSVDELVVDLQLRAGLARTRGPLYKISGGPATLAERLAESIKRSGGTVRLNTPVLRLAYDQSGEAIGVDLLSGERVSATRAIVSNLTIWDTYGKLVGLNRTPPEIKKQLSALQGAGAYVVYATIDETAVARLPGERMLVATTPRDADDDWFSEITVAVHEGTVTLQSATDVNEWFTYHASEEDFEDSDQAALERFWAKLHAAIPELGSGIEIIETANPRTFYEQTRRKLGMVRGVQPWSGQSSSGLEPSPVLQSLKIPSPGTVLPNVFVVGDTVSLAPDVASVAESALSLANHLKTKR
jgi:phytoene dehydrogenase-like protein